MAESSLKEKIKEHWEIAKYRATHPSVIWEEQKQQVGALFHKGGEEIDAVETGIKETYNKGATAVNHALGQAGSTAHNVVHPQEALENAASSRFEAAFTALWETVKDIGSELVKDTFGSGHFADLFNLHPMDTYKQHFQEDVAKANPPAANSTLIPTFGS